MRLFSVETACSVLAMIFKSSPRVKNLSLAAPTLARGRRGGIGGAARREQLHEREPRDEAAYVRRVRDAAALLRAPAEHAYAVDELEQEPEPERDVRGHVREYSE